MKRSLIRCAAALLVMGCTVGCASSRPPAAPETVVMAPAPETETEVSVPETAEVPPEDASPLDDVYALPAAFGRDIRALPRDYSKEQAQADGCFVIGAMVHNDDQYSVFLDRCQQGENAFLRVVQGAEGGVVIDDLLYESRSGQILLVHDESRTSSETAPALRSFAHIGTLEREGRSYWAVYSGAAEAPTEVFCIALIN